MKNRKSLRLLVSALVLAWLLCPPGKTARAQTLSFERDRGLQMITALKEDIKKNYYDATFHGVDVDARFKAAGEKVKQANTVGQIQAIIAQALIDFDDSHLFFLPPGKANRTDYGWQIKMIGNKPYIVAVQPGSDTEVQGIKPGDEIYSLDGFEPTRENMWKMNYFYHTLRPKPAVKFVVINPDGQQREVEVKSKLVEGRRVTRIEDYARVEREGENEAHLMRHRYYEMPEVFIWKMPQFDLSEGEVDDMMDKAKKRKSMILDLRGNGGGYELTLLRLLGSFFDHDVKVGDVKRRKETKPMIAKTRGAGSVFKGQLVVLVDSESGSSAEIFARAIQLEKRGTVIGDRSSGAVMRARHYEHESGMGVVALYGASITDSDVIMSDGKSLEKVGVTPDEILLPTAKAMASLRDPVLARAAELVGVKLDAEKAGSLFPVEWLK